MVKEVRVWFEMGVVKEVRGVAEKESRFRGRWCVENVGRGELIKINDQCFQNQLRDRADKRCQKGEPVGGGPCWGPSSGPKGTEVALSPAHAY